MKTATSTNTAADISTASSSTYSIRIPTPLKEAFDAVAGLNERTGSQLLREFMRNYVQSHAPQELAYHDWYRSQVEATRAAVHSGLQGTAPAADVHAWLSSWGTDAELPLPQAATRHTSTN